MTGFYLRHVERFTFSKHERLCSRLRITEVVTTGRSVHDPPFKLVGKFMQLDTPGQAQIGFAVPRRNIKSAVVRNRVKRLMREAYRLNKARYHEQLRSAGKQCAWLFVFQGKAPLTFVETELKITRALDRWLQQHG